MKNSFFDSYNLHFKLNVKYWRSVLKLFKHQFNDGKLVKMFKLIVMVYLWMLWMLWWSGSWNLIILLIFSTLSKLYVSRVIVEALINNFLYLKYFWWIYFLYSLAVFNYYMFHRTWELPYFFPVSESYAPNF